MKLFSDPVPEFTTVINHSPLLFAMEEAIDCSEPDDSEDLATICRDGHRDTIPIEINAEMGSWEYCLACGVTYYPPPELPQDSAYFPPQYYRIGK